MLRVNLYRDIYVAIRGLTIISSPTTSIITELGRQNLLDTEPLSSQRFTERILVKAKDLRFRAVALC